MSWGRSCRAGLDARCTIAAGGGSGSAAAGADAGSALAFLVRSAFAAGAAIIAAVIAALFSAASWLAICPAASYFLL